MDRWDAMTNVLMQPNAHSIGVMKLLKNYYPAFAKKVFEGNPLMEKLSMIGVSSFDILRYPVCGHCETLAAFISYAHNADGTQIFKKDGSKVGVCRCFKCGSVTVDPITFYDWCLLELKKKAPATIDTDLPLAVDLIAEKCVKQAKNLFERKMKEKVV
jgi:hypothetical protein